MPINVFGTTSGNTEKKNDTISLVKKPYLGTNYIESVIEQDIDMKNQFGFRNLPDPLSIREPASKVTVDNRSICPPVKKKCAHVNFNQNNLDNVRFKKIK